VTPISALATAALENQLVRGLCFTSYPVVSLQSKSSPESEYEESLYPETIILPLVSGNVPISDVATRVRDRLALVTKKVQEKEEFVREYIKTSWELITLYQSDQLSATFIDTIADQKFLRGAIGKPRKEVEKMFGDNLKERLKELEKTDKAKKLAETQQSALAKGSEVVALLEERRFSAQLEPRLPKLNRILEMTQIMRGKYDENEVVSVAKLLQAEKVISDVRIYGFCLDCPYSFTKSGGAIECSSCPNCHGSTVSFCVGRLSPDVQVGWQLEILSEICAAYIFKFGSAAKWVEEVVLHKQIQMDRNGGFGSSVQIDVVVHTKADEVIFVETTASADEGSVENLDRKVRNLEENGIEFDALLYLTAADIKHAPFVLGGDKKACMFSAYQLSHIENEIEEVLKEKLKLKLG
jgi:hypothetical protein